MTDVQKENMLHEFGKLFVTDNKFRLPVYLDERAEEFLEKGVFPIYHLALDHDDIYMNYGIYANGLLVESCSKRFLIDTKDMKLVT